MTVWFVTRHPGAVAWAQRHGVRYDRHVEHIAVDEVKAGDTVIGVLPVNLAAAVCAKDARFFALEITVTRAQRGTELSADALEELQCQVRQYDVRMLS